MADNPILEVWQQALQTAGGQALVSGGDLASAREAIATRAAAGEVSADHINQVGAFLESEEATSKLPRDARVLLAALLFQAAQNHPSLDERIRFAACSTLRQAIPDGRRDLLRLNVEAARAALSCAPHDLPDRARASLLGNLGTSLAQIGEGREALAFLQDALAIYRRLAEAEPVAFEQYVAVTLNNLGNVLGDLGERAGARAAFEEALPIYRRLAKAEPAAFTQYVATTLNNLGNVLRDLGDRAGAQAAFEEALAIRRRLAKVDPAVFEQYVAGTLNNLGNVLRDLGDRERAREVLEEALAIWRRLAETDPDAFKPKVAMTLNNLGIVLRGLGKRARAREVFEEALAIYRRLAEAEPVAFEQYVAMTLNNLGVVLGTLEDRAGARKAFEEALPIYRRLAKAEPAAFEPEVAMTLTNLGNVLRDLGERPGARAAYEEALAIYRRLAQAEPAAFEPYVAGTLNNLGTVLRDLGKRMGARKAFEDALAIRRRLAEAEPAAFEPDVAMTLNNLGTVLRDLGERPEARAAFEEALEIQRRLAEAEPAAFTQYVAGTLNNLGTVLRDLGDRAGARADYEEARGFVPKGDPQLWARITSNLAAHLYDDGERRKGLDLAWQAVEMVETMLADPGYTGVRYSFKGEIENAYRLVLCDPELERDILRAQHLVETLREGELLATAEPGAPHGPQSSQREDANGALVSVQRTHVGTLFLAPRHKTPVFERKEESWANAAHKFLEAVTEALEARRFGLDRTGAIAGAGHELWSALPEAIQELLSSSPPGGIALSLDPETGVLPLELMTPTRKADDFLCLKMEMPRAPGERLFRSCLGRTVADGNAEPGALVFGNPKHTRKDENGKLPPDLPGAEAEARRLGARLRELGFAPALDGREAWVTAEASARKFVDGLRENPTIIHFAGHGATINQEECLLLAGEDLLFADGLVKQAETFAGCPFVFLNSCWVGRARAYGGAFRGLPIAFLGLGAAAVVASVFPLGDTGAALFTDIFSEKLFAGESVGEAMLHTRCAMRDAGANCLHWGLPVLYGNPQARLALPRKV